MPPQGAYDRRSPMAPTRPPLQHPPQEEPQLAVSAPAAPQHEGLTRDTVQALSRSAGNRAVTRMLAERRLGRQPDGGTVAPPAPADAGADGGAPAAPSREQKLAAFRDHVKNGAWDQAVLEANSWSEGDIEREMRAPAVTHQARVEMYKATLVVMFDWPRVVRDKIKLVDAAASVEGRKAYFHFARTQALWQRIAIALGGFESDADIVEMVGWLLPQELTALRDAAMAAGLTARVTGPVRDRIRLHVADEMGSMQGQSAAWTPSGGAAARGPTRTPNTFAAWAEAASETAAPPIDPATTINCWEMVLLAAYRAGALRWQWIHDLYVATPPDSWSAELQRRLTPGGKTRYDRTARPARPRRGDIVYFDGAAHVALGTGVRAADGSDDVYTFWPPTSIAVYTRGTVDKVKTDTIEKLAAFIDGMHPGVACVVEFGAPPW